MSLADECIPCAPPTLCKICLYLNTLDETEQADVVGVLADPDQYPHSTVARALCGRGVDLSESSVKRHRRNHMGGVSGPR